MRFSSEVSRLLIGVLIAFTLIAISVTYWAIIGPDTLWQREDNPRLVLREAALLRGAIIDRRGVPLVTSQLNNGRAVRRYFYQEMSSAVGYFSLRYGVGGAEAAFNQTLRGDDLPADFSSYIKQNLLHMPQIGSDVRVTFDLDVQKAVYNAMRDHVGAAVVMSVPDGAILALVSLPTYNPNTLDADWQTLIAAPGNPFFNRVLQGKYQPGGMLQTPLLAAALLTNQPLNVVINQAANPVTVNTVTVSCAMQPPSTELTLAQAYAYGCPAPFAQLGETLGIREVNAIFESFELPRPPVLQGFVPQQETSAAAAQLDEDLLAKTLGQGRLTITPLNLAIITASIVNQGNAPRPFILLETRAPESETWAASTELRPSIPITTQQVAERLRSLLLDAVQTGGTSRLLRPLNNTGGHAAIAYSGEGAHVWFTGFTQISAGKSVVVAVVIENTTDPAIAVKIGGEALGAAAALIANN